MAPDVQSAFDRLHTFMFERLYYNSIAKNEETKVDDFIHRLFTYFCEQPEKLPKEYLNISEKEGVERAVCDYIAGMTDTYALELYETIFIPKGWHIK